MIDLILIDEDTSVFGYEVSIQDDVLCGALGHRSSDLGNSK